MAEIIEVDEQGTFDLRLPGNPKAGLLWKAVIPPESAELVGYAKPPAWESNPSRIGGTIIQCFSFQALGPGTAILTFLYQRGFGKNPIVEERTYEVHIRPAAAATS